MPIDYFQNYTVFLSGTNLVSGNLTSSITATTNVGAITANQVLPSGLTTQELFETLLVKIYYPTLNPPSVNLSISNPVPSSNRLESGTIGLTTNFTFNQGSIVGKSINGIWEPNTSQDTTRTGPATAFYINNVSYPPTNTVSLPSFQIVDGTNTFTYAVSYLSGDTLPLNSMNLPYGSTIMPSGSTGNVLNITGVRKGFYGLNNIANNSDTIRSAANFVWNPVDGTSFTINITSGSTSVFFAYPSTVRDVTSVIESIFNFNIKDTFTKTIVPVSGANGYIPLGYKVYRFQPVEPYTTAVNYTVSI